MVVCSCDTVYQVDCYKLYNDEPKRPSKHRIDLAFPYKPQLLTLHLLLRGSKRLKRLTDVALTASITEKQHGHKGHSGTTVKHPIELFQH